MPELTFGPTTVQIRKDAYQLAKSIYGDEFEAELKRVIDAKAEENRESTKRSSTDVYRWIVEHLIEVGQERGLAWRTLVQP